MASLLKTQALDRRLSLRNGSKSRGTISGRRLRTASPPLSRALWVPRFKVINRERLLPHSGSLGTVSSGIVIYSQMVREGIVALM